MTDKNVAEIKDNACDTFCLDAEYSTTRMVTAQRPIFDENFGDPVGSTCFLPEGVGRRGEGGLRQKGYFKKRNEHKPVISVITVVFNGDLCLENTILSVIKQSYVNIEYIIIDGGSTDNTLDIIRKYDGQIDYWVSEADSGIYDAMNKGIRASFGDGILFMNSGDYFVGNVLGEYVEIPCFLYVKYKDFFGNFKRLKIKNYKLGLPTSHQGIIFENKKIFYNLDYKIASDYDFYLRHGYDDKLKKNISMGYVYYDNLGVSVDEYLLRDKEIKEIISRNYSLFYVYYFCLLSFLKNVARWLKKLAFKGRLYGC